MGTLKIAPGMPASFAPMITEARTTSGWMPTVSAMMRGCMTFISASSARPMMARVSPTWSGAVRMATMTGGAQAKKGPKKGTAISTPDRTAEDGLSAQEAAEGARHARAQQPELGRVARRDEATHEVEHPVPVHDDVEREDQYEHEVADDREAGQGEVGQRTHQGAAERRSSVEDRPGR